MTVAADLEGHTIPTTGECPICRTGKVYSRLRIHLNTMHGLPPQSVDERNAYQRAYRATHPEWARAQAAKQRAKPDHAAKKRAWQRAWRAALSPENRAALDLRQKVWRAAHRAERNEYMRQYMAKRRAKAKGARP